MAADQPDTEVLVEDETTARTATPWRVILFDDDIHTFEDVIVQLMRAVGCSAQRAEQHAWTVHTKGKDTVFDGDFFECLQVQNVLREIELVTQIEG
jgi:ATP-dependent Clp protease adapter protein ClpS